MQDSNGLTIASVDTAVEVIQPGAEPITLAPGQVPVFGERIIPPSSSSIDPTGLVTRIYKDNIIQEVFPGGNVRTTVKGEGSTFVTITTDGDTTVAEHANGMKTIETKEYSLTRMEGIPVVVNDKTGRNPDGPISLYDGEDLIAQGNVTFIPLDEGQYRVSVPEGSQDLCVEDIETQYRYLFHDSAQFANAVKAYESGKVRHGLIVTHSGAGLSGSQMHTSSPPAIVEHKVKE